MTCLHELRGLGDVQRALAARSGRVLAVSADPLAHLERVARDAQLDFPLLSDVERSAIRAFGLLHADGAGRGRDIALPARVLVRRDATIAWSHVARRIEDRADDAATLAAIEGLS
jgi:peroxiredoxin